MRAMALYGKGDLRLEERPVPHPGPNQLVVKIDYVGYASPVDHFLVPIL